MNSGCPCPCPFPGAPHVFHTPYCRGAGGGEDCPGIPGHLRSVVLGSPASVLAVLLLPLVPPTVWGSGHPPPSHSGAAHVTPRPSPLSPSPRLLQVAFRVTMAMQPLSSAAAFPEESSSWPHAGDTSSSWGSRSFVPERRSGVGRSSGMRAERCVSRSPCLALCSPRDCSRPGPSIHRDCPSKGPGVGCHTLLQGVSA